jgi:hypothetical protein
LIEQLRLENSQLKGAQGEVSSLKIQIEQLRVENSQLKGVQGETSSLKTVT